MSDSRGRGGARQKRSPFQGEPEAMGVKRAIVLALKAEMARQEVSRGDLARILGCTEANVNQMLCEHRGFGMRLHTVDRLAKALGCGAALLLTTRPGAESVLALWEEEARRKGVTLWEWLTAAVEPFWRQATYRFWRRQNFSANVADALTNARIRSWSQLEALHAQGDLVALARYLGSSGLRELEERLAAGAPTKPVRELEES